MTADVIPLNTRPRPVEIRKGDRVEHRESGQRGFVFAIDGRRITVSICGTRETGDIGEWRLV